jgi:hypothetical protein
MGLWSFVKDIGSGLLGLGGIAGDTYADKRNRDMQYKINAENIEMQKDFAQHGISWRVKDAKEAGLHPLAALGAQTTSFSPSSVGAPRRTNYTRSIADALTMRREKEILRGLKLDNDLKAIERNKVLGNVDVSFPDKPSRFYEYKVDDKGYYWLAPTQQNQELVTEMNPWALKIWKNEANRYSMEQDLFKYPNTPFTKKYVKWLARIKPTMLHNGKPIPKDAEMRYVIGKGWKLFKKQNKLFAKGELRATQSGYYPPQKNKKSMDHKALQWIIDNLWNKHLPNYNGNYYNKFKPNERR